MKTRAIATIAPLIALGLVAVAPNPAQGAIPNIKDTAQWRNLISYVNTLEGKRNTPATPAQKESFQQRLNTKQSAANSKVASLYGQRLKQITNRDTAEERRQVNRLLKASQQRVDALQAQRANRIGIAKETFASQVARIKGRFAASIDRDSRQLTTLRKRLAKTSDPVRRQLILNSIDTVENELSQLRAAQRKSINAATDDHRTRIAGIRSKYSARIKDTRAYYQRQIDVVQNSWKVKYADNVAQLKSKRTREYGFVGNCKSRGEGYINQMPPLVQR
ncbi:MAG: hypothetical protein ACKOL0_01540 [Solirubrobacterales bacterium]